MGGIIIKNGNLKDLIFKNSPKKLLDRFVISLIALRKSLID